ncbi:hypothetical protein VTH06DRAFT_7239 [Thermothelomyces fergusii]
MAAPAPKPGSEPGQNQERKAPPIQLPPLTTTLPPISQLNAAPLATMNPMGGNSRANSPTLAHHASRSGTPVTAGFAKAENPALVPMLPLPPNVVPTMDVFDLVGFMDGNKELFRSAEPGQFLRLIDDHQSGVLTTASDSPVQLRIDPRRIKSAERVSAQAGAACVVTLVYLPTNDAREGDQEGEAGPAHTQTLVLEKARSTARGLENGTLHARRLCRRLQAWNPAIVCPAPGSTMDSIQWRFNDQGPATLSAPGV